MLLVNNTAMGEWTPAQLTHADWSGAIHLADLVFPWFLFLVGVSMPLSWASAQKRSVGYWSFLRKAAGRTGILFFLGLVIDSSVRKTPVFGLGVLQLIALSFFVAVTTVKLPAWGRFLSSIGMLAGYGAWLWYSPMPGDPHGTILESSNAVLHLNQNVLSDWSLRGLISVLPAAALVLLGSSFSELVLRRQSWSSVGIASGLGLTLVAIATFWAQWIPMVKPIWSPSYALAAGGCGIVALAVFTAIERLRGAWLMWPFAVAGRNAIVAYVAPILVKTLILRAWTLPGGADNMELGLQKLAHGKWGQELGGWTYTLAYVLIWWAVLFALDRKKIYVRA